MIYLVGGIFVVSGCRSATKSGLGRRYGTRMTGIRRIFTYSLVRNINKGRRMRFYDGVTNAEVMASRFGNEDERGERANIGGDNIIILSSHFLIP